MEGLKEAEANLVVYLHPSKAALANDATNCQLSSLLFTYSEAFEGIVLAYDPEVSSESAKILPGIHPYFGVKLKTRLLLFDPKPDMILEGKVVKITAPTINAVVLRFLAVSIAEFDIGSNFKHKSRKGGDEYMSQSNRNHTIKVGTILRFIVKSFDEEILHISGSLVSNRTGCAKWLDNNVDGWSQADSTTKKRKSCQLEDEKPESERLTTVEETSSLKINERVKKVQEKEKRAQLKSPRKGP